MNVFRWALALIVIAGALACGPQLPAPAQSGVRVAYVDFVATSRDQRWEPWRRIGDEDLGPIFYAVDREGRACIVTGSEANRLASDANLLLRCERWRLYRTPNGLHAAYVVPDTQWTVLQALDGTQGRVAPFGHDAAGHPLLLVDLPRPDTLTERGVIALNCHGQLRVVADTVRAPSGQPVGAASGDWYSFAPGTIGAHMERIACGQAS